MTDRDGNLVQHYPDVSGFDNERYSEDNSAFSVSNRYTGQILDEDTGLYYYGARYYDPELGRFIQADPIVPGTDNSQAFNRYSYCFNNPLKFVDPTGHSPVDWLRGLAGKLAKAAGDLLSGVGGLFSNIFSPASGLAGNTATVVPTVIAGANALSGTISGTAMAGTSWAPYTSIGDRMWKDSFPMSEGEAQSVIHRWLYPFPFLPSDSTHYAPVLADPKEVWLLPPPLAPEPTKRSPQEMLKRLGVFGDPTKGSSISAPGTPPEYVIRSTKYGRRMEGTILGILTPGYGIGGAWYTQSDKAGSLILTTYRRFGTVDITNYTLEVWDAVKDMSVAGDVRAGYGWKPVTSQAAAERLLLSAPRLMRDAINENTRSKFGAWAERIGGDIGTIRSRHR